MSKLSIQFKNAQIVGDIIPAETIPELLVLHGAGSANRNRYLKLRELLAAQGISSCAFDYVGHGDTGGNLEGSSLKERTEITLEVVKALNIPPTTLLGSSMGAYTAIRLLEYFNIHNLILFVPGVYSDKSYELPFGPEFSVAIRKPDSWSSSVVWNILQSFTGKLLIVTAEKDNVIPKAVIEKVYNSALQAKVREIYTIPGATHSFTRYLNENPEQLKELSDKIIIFMDDNN